MKIDIEGYEKELVPSISLDVWENCDAFIEIHTELDRVDLEIFGNVVGLSGKVLDVDLGLNPGGGAIMLGGSTSPLDCQKPSGVGPVSPRG